MKPRGPKAAGAERRPRPQLIESVPIRGARDAERILLVYSTSSDLSTINVTAAAERSGPASSLLIVDYLSDRVMCAPDPPPS
jgi:hypothetical protein